MKHLTFPRLSNLESDRWNALVVAVFGLLIAAFLFGGASRLNELRLAFVEILSLPLFAMVLTLAVRTPTTGLKFPILVALSILAIPLVQVIPLPPDMVLGLPGRQDLRTALELTGVAPHWLTLSVAPEQTWRAALALVPPLAMFGAVILAGGDLGRRAIQLTMALAFAGMLLGAAQFAAEGDRLYLWLTTTPGHIVGFFANRNHLATLTLMTIPFAALFAAQAARASSRDPMATRRVWLWGVFLLLAIVALGAIRSRAGVILLVPALGSSALCAWVAAGRGQPRTRLLAMGAAAMAVVAIVGAFAAGPIMERFEGRAGDVISRTREWPVVLDAAEAYLPLGSGVGSFDPVFRSVEPLEHLDPTFFNHAHNEYLEVLLETGWMGAAALLAFLVWYGRRLWAVWIGGIGQGYHLQRSASIAIALVLAHSAVDYPIRTELIAIVFALCCGILALSNHEEGGRRRRRDD